MSVTGGFSCKYSFYMFFCLYIFLLFFTIEKTSHPKRTKPLYAHYIKWLGSCLDNVFLLQIQFPFGSQFACGVYFMPPYFLFTASLAIALASFA